VSWLARQRSPRGGEIQGLVCRPTVWITCAGEGGNGSCLWGAWGTHSSGGAEGGSPKGHVCSCGGSILQVSCQCGVVSRPRPAQQQQQQQMMRAYCPAVGAEGGACPRFTENQHCHKDSEHQPMQIHVCCSFDCPPDATCNPHAVAAAATAAATAAAAAAVAQGGAILICAGRLCRARCALILQA
jgi:hypothetical protein